MSQVKIITDAEAREIFGAEDAEFFPVRKVNAAGMRVINNWVVAIANEPSKQIRAAWFADAEKSANDAAEGESIIVEMPARMTRTHCPECLRMEQEHFDWSVIVRAEKAA